MSTFTKIIAYNMIISIQITSIKTSMPTEKYVLITVGQNTKRMQIDSREDFKINLYDKIFYRILDNLSLDIGNGKADIWPSLKMMNLNNFPQDNVFNLTIKQKLEKCEITFDVQFSANQDIRGCIDAEKMMIKSSKIEYSRLLCGKPNNLDFVRQRMNFGIIFITGTAFLYLLFYNQYRKNVLYLGWFEKFTLWIKMIFSKVNNLY